jgi:hypothetical protein
MNTKRNIIARLGLLALTLFLALPVAAYAQDRDWYRRGQSNYEWRRRQEEQRRREEERRRAEQWRNRNRQYGGYGNYGYYGYNDFRQTALNAGYNHGIQEGRKDRSRGERFEYRDEGSYRDATDDYNSRYGNREVYRQYYRQGFANGYRDGYNGY